MSTTTEQPINPRLDPNRPRFVLEPWDPHAPLLAKMWAELRQAYVEVGLKPTADLMSADDARQQAYRMERWRHTNETVKVITMRELEANDIAKAAQADG